MQIREHCHQGTIAIRDGHRLGQVHGQAAADVGHSDLGIFCAIGRKRTAVVGVRVRRIIRSSTDRHLAFVLPTSINQRNILSG